MPRYNISLQAISPVHIGDGDVYDPLSSWEYQNMYIPIDSKNLACALKRSGIQVQDFTRWINETKSQRENSKPRISEFIKRNYYDKQSDFHQALVDADLQEIENIALARINGDIDTCMKIANLKGSEDKKTGKMVYRKRPYIPGSEVKGAVVTALFYRFLQTEDEFFNDLEEILIENIDYLEQGFDSLVAIKGLTKTKKEKGFANYQTLGIPREEQGPFRRILTMRERPLNKIRDDLKAKLKYTDARVDEICAKISDWRDGDKAHYSSSIRGEKRMLDERRAKMIRARLEKLETKYFEKFINSDDGNADGHKLMRFLHFSDTGGVGKTKISNCRIVHYDPRITMDLFYEIIDSNTHFQAECRIDEKIPCLGNALHFNKDQQGILNIDIIKSALYQFSKDVIDEDIRFVDGCRGNGYRFPVAEVKAHLKNLTKQNKEKTPLIRLGKGQGFLSLTMALLIRRRAPEAYQKLIAVVQSDKNDPKRFPATRRLIADSNGEYKFPGWIRASFTEAKKCKEL